MRRRIENRLRRISPGRWSVPSAPAAPEALVVGLGNPGPKYAHTRHNIGFRIVERVATGHGGVWLEDRESQSMSCRIELAGKPVVLLAPQTFMNRSGDSVVAALRRWPDLEPSRDLLVVYDDMDLPLGRIRLRPGGGAGGHNGIADILADLESTAVARLRFGIGHPEGSEAVLDWVLGAFSSSDEAQLLPDAIEWAAKAVEGVIAEGVISAMGRFNAGHSSSLG